MRLTLPGNPIMMNVMIMIMHLCNKMRNHMFTFHNDYGKTSGRHYHGYRPGTHLAIRKVNVLNLFVLTKLRKVFIYSQI